MTAERISSGRITSEAMSNIAIKVERLSKRYRIGLKEEMHDTLFGAITSWIKSPISNLRQLQNLTKFDDLPHEIHGSDSLPGSIHANEERSVFNKGGAHFIGADNLPNLSRPLKRSGHLSAFGGSRLRGRSETQTR